MDGVRYFFWLGHLSISPVWYQRRFTGGLLLIILLALIPRLPSIGNFFRRRFLSVFVPPASGLLMVILGTVLRPTVANLGGLWPASAIWFIYFSNVPFAMISMRRMSPYRLLAFALFLFGMWVAFWCAYYSGMSITGEWYEV